METSIASVDSPSCEAMLETAPSISLQNLAKWELNKHAFFFNDWVGVGGLSALPIVSASCGSGSGPPIPKNVCMEITFKLNMMVKLDS